jgi:hypothetical protein
MKAYKAIAIIVIIIGGLICLNTYTRNVKRKAIDRMRAIVSDVRPLIKDCRKIGDNNISIKGKCLVWDITTDLPSRANGILPKEFKSGLSDRQVTVFMILPEREVMAGCYSISGEPGYRQYMDVCVAYWPEKRAVGMRSIVSKEPRLSRPAQQKPEYGDPSEPIAGWIASLPMIGR